MKGQLHIDSMYAFIQKDLDGTEGVIAFLDRKTNTWMPMVGADMEQVDSLRQLAQDTATATKRPVQLAHFVFRHDKEVIHP